MSKIKVGIVGVGGISELHIQAYKKNPSVELYAFCDIDNNRLKEMGQRHNITRLFTDINEMLSSVPELDAVSVCTWNSAHACCTIAALNAGKHVICEKPMAMSAEQAEDMLKAAEKSGKLLMIGFVRRFGNDCSILRDFINKDYFGNLYYAKATYLRRCGNPGGWFGDKTRSGGGPFIDLGVHVIDLIRFLMGNPRAVSVYGATFKKLGNRNNIKGNTSYTSTGKTSQDICDVEDLATAMIRFDNQAVLSVETSFSLNIKKDEGKIELFGTKAGAKIDPELELYTEVNDYLANVSLAAATALDFNCLFDNEINHFVDCVVNKTPCLSPAADGVEIMRILDAVYRSARSGHEVIIDDGGLRK